MIERHRPLHSVSLSVYINTTIRSYVLLHPIQHITLSLYKNSDIHAVIQHLSPYIELVGLKVGNHSIYLMVIEVKKHRSGILGTYHLSIDDLLIREQQSEPKIRSVVLISDGRHQSIDRSPADISVLDQLLPNVLIDTHAITATMNRMMKYNATSV